MKHPPGLLDIQGKAGKGHVVLTVGEDDIPLEEFGTWTEGNQTSCYARTSPGDVVTVRFALNPGVGDFVDLVVDGIRRESTANIRLQDKPLKGVFQRVCCQARIPGTERRAGMKSCEMVVRERSTHKDTTLAVGHSVTVGTLQLQIFRKEPSSENEEEEDQHGASEEPAELAERAPSFIDHATWSEMSCNISSSGPPPPFEIGFINGVQAGKTLKARVSKEWSAQYMLWGVYTFHLRSTADLRALGFENVPTYYSPPSSPSKPITDAIVSEIESSRASRTSSNDGPEADEASDELAELFVSDENLEEDHIIESSHRTTVKIPGTSSTQTTLPGLLEGMASNRRLILGDVANDYDTMAQSTSPDSETDTSIEQNNVPGTYLVAEDVSENGSLAVPLSGVLDPRPAQSFQTEDATEVYTVEAELETGINHSSPSRSGCKTLILPGLNSAPAHQAWLERCSTQDPESRLSTTEKDVLSQFLREDLLIEDSRNLLDDSSAEFAMNLDVPRQLTQSPGFYARLNREIYGSTSQSSTQSSQDKRQTPPRSSSEPRVKLERRNSDGFAASTVSIDRANAPTGFENSNRTPRRTPESHQNNTPTSSQLQSVSVDDDRAMNDESRVDSREMLKQARASAIAKRTADQAQSHSTRPIRELLDAASGASTKVAGSADLEGGRALVFSTKSSSPDETPKLLSQSDISLNEGIHPAGTPELLPSSISHSDSILLKSRSSLSPGIVAQQVRIHWEERPPTLIVPALNQSPTLSQRSLSQSSGTASSSQIRVGNQNRLFSSSPTPLCTTRGLLSHHQPIIEKRKAESISGESHPYSDLAASQPQKAVRSPALVKHSDTEHEMEVVRARIAAAERRRLELDEKWKSALLIKQENDKFKKLVETAEQKERENAEIEAQIAAIYHEDFH